MKLYQTYQISPDHAGMTVEAYLKQILHYSGRKIQKLTRQKGFFVNGKPAYLARQLKANDKLRLVVPDDTSYGVTPEPGTVEILYEDEYLLVLNKPPYQLVHPTGQTTGGTLANYLAYHMASQGVMTTIRPIHRLDRETSGCIIFAKDARSQFLLEEQLKKRSLTRTYQALVQGLVSPPAGTIEAPIGVHPTLPNRRTVTLTGDHAITHYRTLLSLADATLLELTLQTGRTHQIRVHLAHLGFPLIGDKMYGVRSPLLSRQALHAVAVTFRHLDNNNLITVNAPLPEDIIRLLNSFKN